MLWLFVVINDRRVLRRLHIDVNETVIRHVRRDWVAPRRSNRCRDRVGAGGKRPDGESPLSACIGDRFAERLHRIYAPVFAIELHDRKRHGIAAKRWTVSIRVSDIGVRAIFGVRVQSTGESNVCRGGDDIRHNVGVTRNRYCIAQVILNCDR